MSEITCGRCGKRLPTDAGEAFSHCPYCGADLALTPNSHVEGRRFGLGAVVITSVVTSVVVISVLIGAGLGIYFLRWTNSRSDLGGGGQEPTNTKPASQPTLISRHSSIPASDITRVVWAKWHHEGPVSGGGRVVSSSVAFSNDLMATKTESINYDADDSQDKTDRFTGRIDREQFDKLADAVVSFDFVTEPDGKDRISESQNSLTIYHSGGEKTILLNNTGATNSA